MTLTYGSHHIYFVASRGDSPNVDTDAHTVTWDIPRDAFWKDYEVDVTETTKKDRSLTLARVAVIVVPLWLVVLLDRAFRRR